MTAQASRGESLSPSEIAAALIFLTNRKLIWADPHRLHRAVLVARDVCPLLTRFAFSKTGVNPMSRGFDEALGILKLSRIVRMENTDYERYIIDDQSRRYIETEIVPKLTSDERQGLERAAAIVGEACGSKELEPAFAGSR